MFPTPTIKYFDFPSSDLTGDLLTGLNPMLESMLQRISLLLLLAETLTTHEINKG
jgi:hypothetical protein